MQSIKITIINSLKYSYPKLSSIKAPISHTSPPHPSMESEIMALKEEETSIIGQSGQEEQASKAIKPVSESLIANSEPKPYPSGKLSSRQCRKPPAIKIPPCFCMNDIIADSIL